LRVGQLVTVNPDPPLWVSKRGQTSGSPVASLVSKWCIPENHAGVILRRVPTSQRHSVIRGILQTRRRRLIENPKPIATREKLRRTRSSEVDGVVAVNELDGVRYTSGIWKHGQTLQKGARPIFVLPGYVCNNQNFAVCLALVLIKDQRVQEGDKSAARTLTKVSIVTMRPNRNGNWGARMARMTKNAKNRDHGRLLLQCEKV